ncbi:MAG: hypothetical protein KDD82_12095 [Planctomycetes bacterium]|nr:hypothetical protein [Planctomycetota bacterium]
MASPASALRVAEIVRELQGILERLEGSTGDERLKVYADCPPLLNEVKALILPPFPVKEVKSLTHEASWHLRSLAGLTAVNCSQDDEHAKWAKESLGALARCAAQQQAG